MDISGRRDVSFPELSRDLVIRSKREMTVVAGKRVQRSLAAIPAALKTHRKELVDPRTAEHDGRIVKLMGDGALVEFASMVDVVKRAVAIQRGMSERNAHISEDRGQLAEGLRAAGLPG